MNDDDKSKFKELVTVISETYGEEFTSTKLRAWWMLFKPVNIGDFEQAVYSHLTCPDAGMFTPKPANLMKFIVGTSKQVERGIEERAELAWACIEQAIRRIGSYGTLELEDKQALAAVRALGGWKSLCACTTDQLVWKKKEFFSSYDTYERTALENLPSSLPGLIELSEHKKQQADGLRSISDGVAAFRGRHVKGIAGQERD